jgi:hypothetical protein
MNRTRSTERVDPLDDRVNLPRKDGRAAIRRTKIEAVLRRISAACNRTRRKFLSGIPTYMLGASTNLRDHPRQWAK